MGIVGALSALHGTQPDRCPFTGPAQHDRDHRGRGAQAAGPARGLALGHGLVEVPIVFAIAYGLGTWLQQPLVRGVMGVAGAGVLLWMGYGLIVGAWQGRLHLGGAPETGRDGESSGRRSARTVAGGAMLTLTNPYWSFWWVTVGAGRISAVAALQYGPLAIGGLALAHWLTDLGWLGGLSFVTASGRETIGDLLDRGVLLFCGVFLLAFGVYLGWSGAGFLLSHSTL